ncbi:unnamed protein product [Phaeothamnion confervicola]
MSDAKAESPKCVVRGKTVRSLIISSDLVQEILQSAPRRPACASASVLSLWSSCLTRGARCSTRRWSGVTATASSRSILAPDCLTCWSCHLSDAGAGSPTCCASQPATRGSLRGGA